MIARVAVELSPLNQILSNKIFMVQLAFEEFRVIRGVKEKLSCNKTVDFTIFGSL